MAEPKHLGRWQYAALGSELAGAVLLPVLLGLWLDSKFGWSPVAVIIGAFVGLLLVGVLLWQVVAGSNRTADRSDRPAPK